MKHQLAAIVTVLSLSALAPAAPAPKPARARFSSLPTVAIAPRPLRSATPRALEAHERAPWFALAGFPRQMFGGEGPSLSALFATESAARAYEQDPSGSQPNGCFVVDQPHVPSGADWPLSYEAHPQLSSDQGILPARYERLSAHGGRATLTVADAWIDTRSRGARSIGHSTLSFVNVAHGPRGVEVYAARQGRSLHFVVTAPRTDGIRLEPSLGSRVMGTLLPGARPRREQFVGSIARNMTITRSDGQAGRSDCGHARLSLSAAQGGQGATITTDVVLPPRQGEPERELRLRSLLIHLSVSQLSADREPVYSTSFGWRGQTRTLPL